MATPRFISRKKLITHLAVAVGMSIASLAISGTASAHAELTTSSPANGAKMQVAPSQVELTFGTPVDHTTSSIGVKDAAGATVDQGKPFKVRNSANVVGVAIVTKSQGLHTASYRITAADGHPMTGKITFTVGELTATTSAAPTTAAPSTSMVATTTTSSTIPATTPSTAPGLEDAPTAMTATNASSETDSTPPYLPFFVVAIVVGVVAAAAMRRRA